MRAIFERFDIRVSIGYGIVAILWVVLSDSLLHLIFVGNAPLLTTAGIFKGVGFVIVTTLAIFVILRAELLKRRRIELILNQERTMLRTLIDQVPDYIFIKDRASRYLLSNLAHAHAAGVLEPSELIGKTAASFFPADYVIHHNDDDESVLNGASIIAQERQSVDAQGQTVWVSTTKVPLLDGDLQVIGIVGISRNIMARKEAEEALTRERNLLRTLVDHLPAEIYIKDTQSRFLDANSAVAHNVGLTTLEELIGKTDFDFTTPENASRYYQDEQALFTSGIPIMNRETLNPEKTVWRLENKMPLRDSQGQIIGLVGFNWDITERKQVEQAQRESERLRLALEKEQELGDLKTKLMITISHEFRTPLSVAYASAELLEKYYERMSMSQRQEHLRKVETQIKKLTGMLEEITLLIHAKFEQLALNLESVDLSKLCETALLQIQDVQDARHRIVIHAGKPLPHLMLDVRRITYLLTNLLSNALKYSDKATNVSLELFQQEDSIGFRVTDQGIGIPSEQMRHIFEPFYRGNNVGMIGGAGLGLSIAQEIVEMHQGTITVTSEVNHGTQIDVFLPKK